MGFSLYKKSGTLKVQLNQVLTQLNNLADAEKIIYKKQKFGISGNNSLGIYHKDLNQLAKDIGPNDELALALFGTGVYEARILCSKIYNPDKITEQQMESWVKEFDTWEICDSFCMGFFTKSQHAEIKAFQWSTNKHQFIKRAGFAIMAAYGFSHKLAENSIFEEFLIPIEQQAYDDRLYVKKAVNWALRNIGKRNQDLLKSAIATSNKILLQQSKSATWIANNALRELNKSGINILDYPRHIYRNKV